MACVSSLLHNPVVELVWAMLPSSHYIIHLSETLKGERDSNILQALDFQKH